MQLYDRFTVVDLSANKINGELLSNYQPPSNSIDMSVNRLSSAVPLSLRETNISVSVISGNLFGCPLLTNDIAHSGVSEVTCGSESYDTSMYNWLAIAAGVVVLVAFTLKYNSLSATSLKSLVVDWMRASYHHLQPSCLVNKTSLVHVTKSLEVIERVSSMSVVLLTVFVLVVMMAYVGLKLNGVTRINSVYQVQYLYTTTAAYFTGSSPAALIWIFIILSGAVVVILCVRSKPLPISEAIAATRIDDSDGNDIVYQEYQDLLRSIGFQLLVAFLVVALAFAINYGFVQTVTMGHSSNLSSIQFAFTVLKLIFSSVLVPFSSSLIRKEYRAMYSMIMRLVVTTAAPAIAVLLTAPLCLLYRIRPKQVSDTYMSAGITCNFIGSACTSYDEPVTVFFIPKWDYSYQCSSSFLVSYLPIFVNLYMINGIIMPLGCFMMIIYSSSTSSYPLVDALLEYSSTGDRSPFGSIFTISNSVQESPSSSSSLQPDHHDGSSSSTTTKDTSDTRVSSSASVSVSVSSSASSSASNKYDVDVSDLMPGICVDITLLLTFGLASPLLAIPISFSIIINTLLLRLALGRYIVIVSSAIGQAACYQKLENAFSGIWKDLSGILIILIITIIIIITSSSSSLSSSYYYYYYNGRLVGNYECIHRYILVTVCP